MNELMVCFGTGSYIYYKTYEEPIKPALYELKCRLGESGINFDNVNVTEIILRNKSGVDIDREVY